MEGIENEDLDTVMQARVERAQELVESDPKAAIPQLREFLKGRKAEDGLDNFQEQAAYLLMKAYQKTENSDALIALLGEIRASFDNLSKSKRENIVKNVFERLASIPGTEDKQYNLCREYIAFLRNDKRDFLRQRFETKLAALLVKRGEYQEALKLVKQLSQEVKKVDDKLLLVEIYLIESKVHFALDDISKARSSLTAARTNSNTVYIGIGLQAEIDLQAGVINAHERDFRTAYSYIFEAHEGFLSRNDREASFQSLIYMLLARIMNDKPAEVAHILNAKTSLQFTSEPSVIAIKKIADAVKSRSLQKFSVLLEDQSIKDLLSSDKLVRKTFKDLQDELLEKNLARVIEPYSRVEVERIAQLMEMDEEKVMTKLTQMILDKKLLGVIDQGAGELIIHDAPPSQQTYSDALNLIENMGNVVNNLVRRAKSLHAQ